MGVRDTGEIIEAAKKSGGVLIPGALVLAVVLGAAQMLLETQSKLDVLVVQVASIEKSLTLLSQHEARLSALETEQKSQRILQQQREINIKQFFDKDYAPLLRRIERIEDAVFVRRRAPRTQERR